MSAIHGLLQRFDGCSGFKNSKLRITPANKTIVAFLLWLLFAAGCSVQKNTGLSRTFHNVTAKFNVLFNGKESFEKGVAKIDAGLKDDYAELLPVFNYVSKDAVDLAASDMDRTIKKCSKLISLHSITAKPKVKGSKNLTPKEREFFNKKEYNLYVDDAYLLMGKSHFYKHDFTLAMDVFRLILNDFKNQPVVFETQVWLGRALIETAQYKEAYEILNLLLNNADFPKKLLPDLFPTMAWYYMTQKDYLQAIGYLEKSLALENRKKLRTRYSYILAQLYERTGNLKHASEEYALVVKMNPVYDMAFNARINRALAFQQGFGQSEDIVSELTKMLRDDKNKEYQDQIYYALGNLAAKEGDNARALEHYRKSVAVNVNNEQQKSRSFLTIANLYYAIPDYPNAQAYYDSALAQIGPDYPGYEALFTKSKSLTRLVKEINTVQFEDSMLMLAKLPQPELNARIDALVESERLKAEFERQRQQEEQLDRQFGNEIAVQNLTRTQNTADAAQWYFYNETARSQGYREFKLLWGNRKLEDHWQRTNKTVAIFAGSSEETLVKEEEPVAPSAAFSKLSREYYLVNIPRSDSAVTASGKRIESALYNMGILYKTDLKDYEKSSASFRELTRRFPTSEYVLSAYFNLYSIAREQNNQALTESYKNIIASQFPQSMYAKVLTNPGYIQEMEAEEKKIQDYYSTTYDLYKAGNYAEVISRSAYALQHFAGNLLIPRFAYLGILAEGKNADRKVFRDKLRALAVEYPGTEVAAEAQSIVDYMDRDHPELKIAEEKTISQRIYKVSPEKEHVFAFVGDKKASTNQLVFNIVNFNLDLFDNLNLRVEIIELNSLQNLVVVKPFRDKTVVMPYLDAVRSSEDIKKDIPGYAFIPFAISSENLVTLREDKSAERYMIFFNENYK